MPASKARKLRRQEMRDNPPQYKHVFTVDRPGMVVRKSAAPFLKEEPILDDNDKIYGNYLYIVDGVIIMSDHHDITVRQLKVRTGAKEVRRCDQILRGLDESC